MAVERKLATCRGLWPGPISVLLWPVTRVLEVIEFPGPKHASPPNRRSARRFFASLGEAGGIAPARTHQAASAIGSGASASRAAVTLPLAATVPMPPRSV